MKAIIFAKIFKLNLEQKDHNSLEAQVAILHKYWKTNNVTIIKEFRVVEDDVNEFCIMNECLTFLGTLTEKFTLVCNFWHC